MIPARLSGYRGATKISITLHKCEISGGSSHAPGFGSNWRYLPNQRKNAEWMTSLYSAMISRACIGRGEGGDVAVCFINPINDNAVVAGIDLEKSLARYGTMPLPPYISRPDGATTADESDYQTMFAQHPGAVAAPTAGLHFTPALAAQLTAKMCRLSKLLCMSVRVHFCRLRLMIFLIIKCILNGAISSHAASLIQTAQQSGHRIIAVGTTSLRILEACFQQHGSIQTFAGETDIFITPGFKFGVVDALLTNFHLPKSTLLMLISAFCGMGNVRAAYQHAIAGDYRFFLW